MPCLFLWLPLGATSWSSASLSRGAPLRAVQPSLSLLEGQRHFLHVDDLTGSEVREVLELAKQIKKVLGTAEYQPFTYKTLSMVFTKPSTRTRVSFESGFFRLGGHALCLGEEIGCVQCNSPFMCDDLSGSKCGFIHTDAHGAGCPCQHWKARGDKGHLSCACKHERRHHGAPVCALGHP